MTALTNLQRGALVELRRKVTLERAALTPPQRAAKRGYTDWTRDEPVHRPNAAPDWAERNPDIANHNGDAWTNDVAESLRIYTDSWVLPIIDALLGTEDPIEDIILLAHAAGIAPNGQQMRAAREAKAKLATQLKHAARVRAAEAK